MTALYSIIGAAAAACLVLIGRIRYQSSANYKLYSLIAVAFCWVASWPLGVAANEQVPFLGADALTLRTAEHVLRLLAIYALILFITAADSGRRLRSVATRQIGPVLVASLTLVVIAEAAIPTSLRAAVAARANGQTTPNAPDIGFAGMTFFAAENLYYLYAVLVIAWWARRRRGLGLAAPLRWGLRMIELGALVLALATTALLISGVLSWASSPRPVLQGIGLFGMTLGLVVLTVGLLYAPVAAAVARARAVHRQRQAYRALEPLWSLIHAVLPEHELPSESRGPGEWLGAPGRATTRRYYRRVVECRDGLLRLGVYVEEGTSPNAPTPSPAAVAAAVDTYRATAPDPRSFPPRVLAIPGPQTLAEDAAELVQLSAGLRSVDGQVMERGPV